MLRDLVCFAVTCAHTDTHCIHYLAPLTCMHAIMEARRFVPADFALHADT